MNRILLSAFACQPNKGSEFNINWSWAVGLADMGFEVHCITLRSHRPFIESVETPKNLHFHYIALPLGLQVIHKFTDAGLYLHYILWQWLAYKRSKKLHAELNFSVAHHVGWGSIQLGSFLYKLDTPFIFGPAGGGQKAPKAFKKYFLGYWKSELMREKVADWLIKYNPACKKMLREADAVIVCNQESLQLVQDSGAKNCYLSMDHGLQDDFYPENFVPRSPTPGTLKMLWVGTFMPRKGVLLNLEVMASLKKYPNITLTIVGDGQMKADIVKAIKDYGLEETVKLTGMVPYAKVREYYASHDVFFFTSLRDSGPTQLTEAMGHGLPLVTINIHGQRFVVNDDTGIRCKCDTPEIAVIELEKAILYLYNNPAQVTKMSQAAYDFARKQTWRMRISDIVQKHYPVKL